MTGEEIAKLQEIYNSLSDYLHSEDHDSESVNDALKGIQHILQRRGIFVS
ncbi:hypothetical protein KQI43_04395 [Bacillus atrophaeus]|nr:hypothetical protein [Bacillus atrophaeus]